jgi:hypothetical protein
VGGEEGCGLPKKLCSVERRGEEVEKEKLKGYL